MPGEKKAWAEPARAPISIVVMGVAGCGKTAVGEALASRTGAVFIEGDDLHPPENVASMARGEPLDDDMRAGWLDAIGRRIARTAEEGNHAVVACSALKRSYRDRLRGFGGDLLFLYLKIDPATARARVAARKGHFMPASLVDSQFAILEEPQPDEAALVLDATRSVEDLAGQAACLLRGAEPSRPPAPGRS